MRQRDPALRSVLEQHAAVLAARIPQEDGVTREVCRMLATRMAEGEMQIETVARALGASTRSLQRRLAKAGLSFQELLEHTRRDAASEYLSNSQLSIGEVAYLLGYSEPAAFHRAFKRWHGITPREFRTLRNNRSHTIVR